MSKLVIAEKPMLARDIARAITGKEVSESARLPISGNGYTVCACAGHLLELVKPDAIDPKWGMPWSLDVLPIEVHDWPKEPAVDKKTGESKKPLIDQIAGLLETCDSVIAAGDPDDEGQLIVDELLDYLGYAGRVERVYVNDNIEKNIVKAFDKLVPNDSCRGAGNAAYARQMADMCFGVNETRLATKRLDGLFTVGRVQTPTLGLVVKRDEAIAHHVTRKFYELFASGDSDAGELTFKYLPGKELLAGEKHLFERHTLEALKEKLDGRDLHFETTVSKKQENPPLALRRSSVSLGCIATPRKLYAVTRCDTVADGIESVLVHPCHQLFAKTLPANRVHEDVDLLRNIQSSHLEVPSAFGKLCLPPLLLSINIADWHTSKQKNTI